MIIAIDGLAVNGKTTLAERIAKETGFKKFSAGTIYRCIALEIVNKKLDINDIKNTIHKIENIEIDFIENKTYLNGKDVSQEIRKEEISLKSNKWATIPEIKELVRKIQKSFLEKNDTVMEGRDIGTRIAPNADVKFYLYSDFETRVERWQKDTKTSIEEVRNSLKKIDEVDLNEGNFVKPVGAIEIDTTNKSLDEVFEIMIREIKRV